MSRSSSEPTLSNQGTYQREKWSSTGNITAYDSDNYSSSPSVSSSDFVKKVRWNPGVRVVLIPTRSEYHSIRLAQFIWWSEADYSKFRESAAVEIYDAMRYLKLDMKDAIRTLYQPQNISNPAMESSIPFHITVRDSNCSTYFSNKVKSQGDDTNDTPLQRPKA